MISKKDILKMVHKVTKRSHGSSDRKVIHPHREWGIGVGIFLIVALSGGVITARDYVYYNTLESRVENTAVPTKKYQEQDVVAAIATFEKRMEVFNTLISEVNITPRVEEETASSSEEVVESNEEDSDETDAESETPEIGSESSEGVEDESTATSTE